MISPLEVFIAAGGPSRHGLGVVHDTTNASAGLALAVIANIAGGITEVMAHAGVVANLMGHDLLINQHV